MRVHGSIDGERCDLESIKPRPSDPEHKYELLETAQPGHRGAGYWASYFTVMSISFAGFVDYAVIMPSAQDYCTELGASKFFYGASLALFPLARIVLLPFAGLASDSLPMRLLLFATVLVQLIGGVAYGLAEAADSSALILVGRVVAGVGSTNIAMVQKFVVSTSKLELRSRAIAIMQAINFLGIALGPALNFVLAKADVHLFGAVYFNKFTGAGFMLACVHALNLFFVVFLFKDDAFALPPVPKVASSALQRILVGFKGVWNTDGAVGVCTSAMIAMVWLSLLETLVAPICKDSFGWELQKTSVFFAIFAVLAALLMGVVGVASKCFSDRSLVICSTPLYALAGLVAYFEVPQTDQATKPWFYLLAVVVSCGFTCQNAPSMGLFTKLMSGSASEGLASGVALQMQGFGRVLGPLIAGAALDNGGVKVCCYVLAGILVIQIIVISRTWKFMVFEPSTYDVLNDSSFLTPAFLTPCGTPPDTPSASRRESLYEELKKEDDDDEEQGRILPNLTGVWKHSHDDTKAMDALLNAEGVGYFNRKMFKLFHPKLTIDQSGNHFSVQYEGVAGKTLDVFNIGDRFDALDVGLNKTITWCTRWETEPGRPVTFHQFSVDTPTRGCRRWLERQGAETLVVQEVEIAQGHRAKRYFRAAK